MKCPFCNVVSRPTVNACDVCGGPLRGTFRPLTTRSRPGEVAPNFVAPVPVISVLPAPHIPRSKPELLAHKKVNQNGNRFVAAGFWEGETDCYPLFLLQNGALQVWNMPGDVLHNLSPRRTLSRPGLMTCAAFSVPCGMLATGHESGQVRLQRLHFDVERSVWKFRAVENIHLHQGRVWSLCLMGTQLYSAGSDGAVVLTELPTFSDKSALNYQPQVILDGLGALSCLALSPNGRLLALGSDDGQVQMWHLDAEGIQASLDWTTRKTRAAVKSLQFARNGNMLLCGDAQGSFCLRAALTGHELQRLTQDPAIVAPPVFAPDSRLLAFVNAQNGIGLLDAWTGELRRVLEPALNDVQTLTFSAVFPTATTEIQDSLLTASDSQQILAWKIAL